MSNHDTRTVTRPAPAPRVPVRRSGAAQRARRWALSWPAMVAAIVVLVGAGTLAFTSLTGSVRQRALASAQLTRRVTTTLVVERNFTADDFAHGSVLSDEKRADMDEDVAALSDADELLGLEVWRADGTLAYADPSHPTAELMLPEDEQAELSTHDTAVNEAEDDRGRVALEILSRFDVDHDGVTDGIVEVVLPPDAFAQAVASATHRLYALVAFGVALLGAIALVIRRRLAARTREAMRDSLTGLPNRAALHHSTQGQLERQSGDPFALLLLDLDGFKEVNDTLGHDAGDVLLIQVAATLAGSVQPVDTVARLGGDEFAVVLRHVAGPGDAMARARALVDELRRGSFVVDGVALAVDASIGVALWPEHATTIDHLLQRADIAMYRAKRSRAGATLYDESLDPHDVGRLGLLAELRHAIEHDELLLHYQPKARCGDNRTTSVEALVRWQHPTRGLLPPDQFLPMAEPTVLMAELTRWVLHRATDEAKRWYDAGAPMAVAVNISPRTLTDGDLEAMVAAVLAETALPPELLELEVTETAIMAEPERAAAVLRSLRARNVRVAIDDFGVGYTSLALLKTLPIDVLKIDRVFINRLLSSKQDRAIVESVINLGHQLGLQVVAEGVESVLAWEALEQMGCDEIQGFILSPPVDAQAFGAWRTVHDATTATTATTATPVDVDGHALAPATA